MQDILIDDEFKNYIRPLDEDELQRLGTSITEDGIRDPLVAWEETGILLDGHHRYKLANGREFQVKWISLPDRLSAKKWIIKNQMARRNLTPQELSYFRGLRYQAEKQTQGEYQQKGKIYPFGRTSQQLADEYGVSEKTIRNDAEFLRAVDTAEQKLGNEVKRQALKGEISKRELQAALRADQWGYLLSSEEVEWYTPKKYIDAVKEVMGAIDLDPASCAEANAVIGATMYYSKENDGLAQPWHGRVFLNPPYGATASSEWTAKLYHELEHDVSEAILLVNSRSTDAEWFQPCFDAVICFTDHRIDFDSPQPKRTSSTHGSCFVYWGPNAEKFAQVFSKFGNVVRRWPI